MDLLLPHYMISKYDKNIITLEETVTNICPFIYNLFFQLPSAHGQTPPPVQLLTLPPQTESMEQPMATRH